MSMTIGKRNGKIELLRFIAAISIAVYHFEWVYIGHPVYFVHFYIWVEFFFVLSGFFLASNCCKSEDQKRQFTDALPYTLNEWRKLYPMYCLAFIWSFIAVHMNNAVNIKSTIYDIWEAKWEILLCNIYMFDQNSTMYNVTSTYIASMLLISLIIFYLIQNHKKLFICVIGPLSVMLGYGRIISQYGNLSQWLNNDGFVTASIIRAMAGMSLGALCYLILVDLIKNNQFIQNSIEIGGIFSICILVLFRDEICFSDLILWPFIFGGFISVLYNRPVKLTNINTCFCLLGKLAYPIFLFHYGILIIFTNYFPKHSYGFMMTAMIVSVLILSSILTLLQYLLKKSKNHILS